MIYDKSLYTSPDAMLDAGMIYDQSQSLDQNTINENLKNEALYFTSVAVSVASTAANIVSISNAKITANHVLARCEWAAPGNITSDVTWTTAAGSLTLNGTCSTATTANILLVKKQN